MNFSGLYQFLKFAVVGVINTLIDWAVFYLLIYFLMPDQNLTAKAVSFAVAVINSFILNSIWTFKDEFYRGLKNKDLKFYNLANYFIRFIFVSLIGFAINYLMFRYVIFNASGWLADHSNIVGLFAASGASLVWNYIINKFWTYKKTEDVNSDEVSKKVKSFKFDLVAAVILFVSLAISFSLISRDSAIVDETAHIPAGYSYVKYNDYRLNPEHPPLAKYLSGTPLQFLNLEELKLDSSWDNILQWDSGWYFIFNSGNNPDQVIFWARLPMLLFVLALGILIYKWASEEFGNRTGLFVLLLFAFTPDVLAHGHFVTTDVPAAFGFTLAAYTFKKYLDKKNTKFLIIAAIGLGIAQLLKFSAFMLYPIFFFLIIIKSNIERKESGKKFFQIFWPHLKSFVQISLLSLLLVWLVYIPMVWNMTGDLERRVIDSNISGRGQGFRNFLYIFADNTFLRAFGHYLLGLFMVFVRVAGGNSTYILGYFSDKAISWFFPVAFLIKTPATILILFIASVIALLTGKLKSQKNKWLLWVIGTPFVFYWTITLKGSLNIGTRHLLPVLPFLYIFIGLFIKKIIDSKKLIANIALIAIVLTLVLPVAAAYPRYISYFNIFTYGREPHNLMVDSSMDWGQDLKRLATFVNNNEIKEIKVDYFGGGLPKYYIPQSTEWRSGYGPTTGWIAISGTFYQMSKLHGKAEGKWSYEWLDNIKPVAIIGDSILVYNITDKDLTDHPPVSSYPIIKYDVPKEGTGVDQI